MLNGWPSTSFCLIKNCIGVNVISLRKSHSIFMCKLVLCLLQMTCFFEHVTIYRLLLHRRFSERSTVPMQQDRTREELFAVAFQNLVFFKGGSSRLETT